MFFRVIPRYSMKFYVFPWNSTFHVDVENIPCYSMLFHVIPRFSAFFHVIPRPGQHAKMAPKSEAGEARLLCLHSAPPR